MILCFVSDMPGRICAVSSCKNNRLALTKEGIRLIFHYFPKGYNLVGCWPFGLYQRPDPIQKK